MVCTRHVVAEGQEGTLSEGTLSETEGWVRKGFLVEVMPELVFKDDAGLLRQECFCSLCGARPRTPQELAAASGSLAQPAIYQL